MREKTICKLFLKNKKINPVTGRKIQKGKKTYNTLMELCIKHKLVRSPKSCTCKKPSDTPVCNEPVQQFIIPTIIEYEPPVVYKDNKAPVLMPPNVTPYKQKAMPPNVPLPKQSVIEKKKVLFDPSLGKLEMSQNSFQTDSSDDFGFAQGLLDQHSKCVAETKDKCDKTKIETINDSIIKAKGDKKFIVDKATFRLSSKLYDCITKNGFQTSRKTRAYLLLDNNPTLGQELSQKMQEYLERKKEEEEENISNISVFVPFLTLSPIAKENVAAILIPKGTPFICFEKGENRQIILCPGQLIPKAKDDKYRFGLWDYGKERKKNIYL